MANSDIVVNTQWVHKHTHNRLCNDPIDFGNVDNPDLTNFKQAQEIVRAGLAKDYFIPHKTQLKCNHSEYGELVWDVIGVDLDVPVDPQYTHSVTLQLNKCIPSIQFDEREAFYYAENGLAAGTYNFTVDTYYYLTSEAGKTYQFTLNNDVPPQGQLVWSANYNQTLNNANVLVYNKGSQEVLESAIITEGNEGISLGNIGNNFNNNLNSSYCAVAGNSNWYDSAIRQYFNSDQLAGDYWKPLNNWDRPPSWINTKDGFLYGLDDDFKNILGEVTKTTYTNILFGTNSWEYTNDKIFLLSRYETYCGTEGTNKETIIYPYYSEYSDLTIPSNSADSNKVKLNQQGSKYSWGLRCSSRSVGHQQRLINTSGALGSDMARSGYAQAPACCII